MLASVLHPLARCAFAERQPAEAAASLVVTRIEVPSHTCDPKRPGETASASAESQNPSAAASAPRGTNRTRACGLAYSNLRLMRAHLRLMRRVLAPLRRCLFDDGRRTRLRRSFADDDRRTRLRALYEDAALVARQRRGRHRGDGPHDVIADRKIADASAARRF